MDNELTRPASSPREVFEMVHCAILDGQMDVYADLFAADGTFELPFAPPGIPRRIEGREAIRVFVRAGAEMVRARPPQWQVRSVVVHETVDPAVIVTEFEVRGVSAQGAYRSQTSR